MKKYDVAVIGSGPGGYAAATAASQLEAKTVIIERDEIGGVCLNWGCIPTKALIASAKIYNFLQRANEFGIQAKVSPPNISKIYARKNSIVSNLRNGMNAQLKRLNIDFIKGEAFLKTENIIEIKEGNDKFEIDAGKIIIATGSYPRGLKELPFNGRNILDSKSILDLTKLPRSLLIVGGGAIGCEFANIFNFLNVEVTIVELENQLLPLEDKELGRRLASIFKKRGIDVLTGEGIVESYEKNESVKVKTNKDKVIEIDKVLVAVGRVRNIDGLGLDELRIKLKDDNLLLINKYLETTVQDIYAVGDVLSSPQLAHVAAHEGMIAAYNSTRENKHVMDYNVVPNCIFTVPEIATVGFSKDEALQEKIDADQSKYLYSALGKPHCDGTSEGFVKIVYETRSKEILGAQIMGEGASDLISEISLAIKKKLTLDDVASTIHPHPTFSEVIQEAALVAIRE